MNNKEITRYIKRNYKELKKDEFYLEYQSEITESYQKIKFAKELSGPIKNYDIKDFYELIAHFFCKYYNDKALLESINKKILVYTKEELLEFINYCNNNDTLGIIKSRVTIGKEACLDLIDNHGMFYCPIVDDYWQILLLDLKSIETILNLIHEYTHKIHYYNQNGFTKETSVITEMAAYYNTAIFTLYLQNKNISLYDLLLNFNSTEHIIKEELSLIPIYQAINNGKSFNSLNTKEKELITKYYNMGYFPPKDYYHHLAYYLFKENFSSNRDLSIEEHTLYLKEVMNKRKVKELINC